MIADKALANNAIVHDLHQCGVKIIIPQHHTESAHSGSTATSTSSAISSKHFRKPKEFKHLHARPQNRPAIIYLSADVIKYHQLPNTLDRIYSIDDVLRI